MKSVWHHWLFLGCGGLVCGAALALPASLHPFALAGNEHPTPIAAAAVGPEASPNGPDEESPSFLEAVRLQRDGYYDAALAAYRECLRQPASSSRADAFWRAAQLCESLHRLREANELYRQLQQEFPHEDHSDQVLLGQARTAAAIGKDDLAATACQSLLTDYAYSPQAAEAAYWLAARAADEQDQGLSFQYLDWLSAALQTHFPAERHSRLWVRAAELRCRLAAQANDWQEIAEYLDANTLEEFQEKPTSELTLWRAEAAFRLLDYATARHLYATLAPQVVGSAETWVPLVALRRAQLACHSRQWKRVLELLADFEVQHPDFDLIYEVDYLRGRALAETGDSLAARAAYAEVLRNPRAQGTETANQAAWMTGETYFHQRNFGLAKAEYLQMLNKVTEPQWQTRLALRAGRCAELEEQWEEARQIYSRALGHVEPNEFSEQLNAQLRWAEERTTLK